MSLKSAFTRYLPQLEQALQDFVRPADPGYRDYYGMMHYHMGWVDEQLDPIVGQAGKRVRPILCLLACEGVGGDPQKVLPAAAGIEILHNFSLIHDDVEDNSQTRRGRPTVWALWGEPQAINAGDGLFALAYLAFCQLPARGMASDKALAAIQVFGETCMALTQGQFLDMTFEGRLDVTTDHYLKMIEGKTATLIATATYLGAFLGGANPTTAQAYRAFGRHLGLVFQIQDDILGIWGDADVLGKSTSSDIETRKNTLPVVYGLERSQRLRQLYAQGEFAPETVNQVVQILQDVGARQAAKELAQFHHQESLRALERAAPIGPAEAALRELANSLLDRVS